MCDRTSHVAVDRRVRASHGSSTGSGSTDPSPIFELPHHVYSEILRHLDGAAAGPTRFRLATLLRRRDTQAASFCSIHPFELDGPSRNGRVALLDILLRHARAQDRLPRYTTSAVDDASKMGWVAVLQWWKDSGLPLRYSVAAMNFASHAGRVEVLQWWKDSGLELKYSRWAMDLASHAGRVQVLQWWKDSGLQLQYSESVFMASFSGSREAPAVLQWWKDSGLRLKVDEEWVRGQLSASRFSREVARWWQDSGLIKYQLAEYSTPFKILLVLTFALLLLNLTTKHIDVRKWVGLQHDEKGGSFG